MPWVPPGPQLSSSRAEASGRVHFSAFDLCVLRVSADFLGPILPVRYPNCHPCTSGPPVSAAETSSHPWEFLTSPGGWTESAIFNLKSAIGRAGGIRNSKFEMGRRRVRSVVPDHRKQEGGNHGHHATERDNRPQRRLNRCNRTLGHGGRALDQEDHQRQQQRQREHRE